MKNIMLKLMLAVIVLGCTTEDKPLEETIDLFGADMAPTLGLYPEAFISTDSGCKCSYVIKNATDSTLSSLRVNVKVHNEEGSFDCDIGLGATKVASGGVEKVSNLAVGKQCGTVKQVELFYVNRCRFDEKSCELFNPEQFVLKSHNGVSWK